MWLPAETTVAPIGDPILLADLKKFLRIDEADTESESTIAGQLAAAVLHIEKMTGIRLITQTAVLRASDFCDLEHFPIGPVQSVVSITYLDSAGGTQTLDPSAYEHFGADLDQGVRPAFNTRWPTTRQVADAVRVTVTAGYGAAGNVPWLLQQAISMLAADWYSNREDTVAERGVKPETMPNGVESILVNFRP